MANTTISPNMNMPVPVVSVDPGPDWATNIDSCLSIIDSHNHNPNTGQGVAINPGGININSDLPFNINSATTVKSIAFSSQNTPLTALNSLYESGVDLYFTDGSGNQIRITQSGSVTGSSGTITGLPSGTASASFAAGTFTFQSATNTPAAMNFGSVRIAQLVASGFGVTLFANAGLAANYNLTLPLGLPSTSSSLISDSSGNLSFVQIGQVISSVVLNSSSVSLVSNVAKTITSISLPSGTWAITGIVGTRTGAGSATNFTAAINTVTDTLPSDLGDNSFSGAIPTTTTDASISIASYVVTLGSPTTYYLIGKLTFSGTGGSYGRINAVRLA